MIAISTTLWIGKAGAGANTSDASELFRHVVRIEQYHVLKRTILLQDMKKRVALLTICESMSNVR